MPKKDARSERDDQDLVRLYLNDIGRYPLLTKDDEARLIHPDSAKNVPQPPHLG